MGGRAGTGHATGAFTAGQGDVFNTAPRLAPLGDYGGPTFTMALRPGSPARNAAPGSALLFDQRGFPRGGTPDIGAYEAGTLANFAAWSQETTGATLGFDTDQELDGTVNGLEYALHRDPFVSDTPLAPTLSGAPAGPRTFTFRYRADARDLRYIVQRNADLANAAGWTEIYRYDSRTGQITELFSVTGDENATTQIITLTDPATGPRLFWRLRLEQLP